MLLGKNHALRQLDLGHNNIEVWGAKAIARLLETNHTLTQLNLSGNNIGDEGAKSIARLLETNRGLIKLDLGNKIGDEGAKSIARSLKTNHTLTQLNLGKDVGDEGATAIARALEYNKGLIHKLANIINHLSNDQKANIEVKYYSAFKFYQVVDKELLKESLSKFPGYNDDEKLQQILNNVDNYISHNYFKLAGICRNFHPGTVSAFIPGECLSLIESFLELHSLWEVKSLGDHMLE